MLLIRAQIETLAEGDVLKISNGLSDEIQPVRAAIAATLASSRRCRVEQVDGLTLWVRAE